VSLTITIEDDAGHGDRLAHSWQHAVADGPGESIHL
jgi:hypothetical protein